ILFFFSSRRRHTRSTRDWSSDVCSSDLFPVLHWRIVTARDFNQAIQFGGDSGCGFVPVMVVGAGADTEFDLVPRLLTRQPASFRSEERRVGKECRSRCGTDESTNNVER